jgi:hypothetical protein
MLVVHHFSNSLLRFQTSCKSDLSLSANQPFLNIDSPSVYEITYPSQFFSSSKATLKEVITKVEESEMICHGAHVSTGNFDIHLDNLTFNSIQIESLQ